MSGDARLFKVRIEHNELGSVSMRLQPTGAPVASQIRAERERQALAFTLAADLCLGLVDEAGFAVSAHAWGARLETQNGTLKELDAARRLCQEVADANGLAWEEH